MKEQLISFETAKLAKEKGFDIPVIYGYQHSQDSLFVKCYEDKHCYNSRGLYSAPTQSLLQKWLREIHRINASSDWLPNMEKYGYLASDMTIKPRDYKTQSEFFQYSLTVTGKEYFENYEDSLEMALVKGLKMIK